MAAGSFSTPIPTMPARARAGGRAAPRANDVGSGAGRAPFINCLPLAAADSIRSPRRQKRPGRTSFFHHFPVILSGNLAVNVPAQTHVMTSRSSLILELEQALAAGTQEHRVEMLTRITDLFLAGANRYSDVQINLFDEVMTKLTSAIEAKARARLAARLADSANAPPSVIRKLAADDDIEVARPVLKDSQRLTDADLLAQARIKSQPHLLAISQRKSLS